MDGSGRWIQTLFLQKKKQKKKPADWVRHQWKPIRIDKSGRLLLGFAFGLCRSISRHFTPTRTDSRTLTPVLCLAACLKREFSSCAPGFPSHSAGAHSSAPLFFFFFLEKKKKNFLQFSHFRKKRGSHFQHLTTRSRDKRPKYPSVALNTAKKQLIPVSIQPPGSQPFRPESQQFFFLSFWATEKRGKCGSVSAP